MAEVHTMKETRQVEAKLTYAWMNAYYQRVDKLEPLKECIDEALGRKSEEDGMTDDDMLATVRKLNAQYGGTVEEGKETEQ